MAAADEHQVLDRHFGLHAAAARVAGVRLHGVDHVLEVARRAQEEIAVAVEHVRTKQIHKLEEPEHVQVLPEVVRQRVARRLAPRQQRLGLDGSKLGEDSEPAERQAAPLRARCHEGERDAAGHEGPRPCVFGEFYGHDESQILGPNESGGRPGRSMVGSVTVSGSIYLMIFVKSKKRLHRPSLVQAPAAPQPVT